MSDILAKIYEAEQKAVDIINQTKNDIENAKVKYHSELTQERENFVQNFRKSNQDEIMSFQQKNQTEFENKKSDISIKIDDFLKKVNKKEMINIVNGRLNK